MRCAPAGRAAGGAAVRGLGGAGSLALSGGASAFRAGAGAVTFGLQARLLFAPLPSVAGLLMKHTAW